MPAIQRLSISLTALWQLTYCDASLVQQYVSNPLLIDGYKVL
jgi:hypothetical protein